MAQIEHKKQISWIKTKLKDLGYRDFYSLNGLGFKPDLLMFKTVRLNGERTFAIINAEVVLSNFAGFPSEESVISGFKKVVRVFEVYQNEIGWKDISKNKKFFEIPYFRDKFAKHSRFIIGFMLVRNYHVWYCFEHKDSENIEEIYNDLEGERIL